MVERQIFKLFAALIQLLLVTFLVVEKNAFAFFIEVDLFKVSEAFHLVKAAHILAFAPYPPWVYPCIVRHTIIIFSHAECYHFLIMFTTGAYGCTLSRMETTAITVFKWVFVAAAIWLSFYHYRREIKKINLISKQLDDARLVRSLKKSARSRMLHFLIFFSAFIVWILVYDLVNEDVNRKNYELSVELQDTANTYTNLFESQQRLVAANNKGDLHAVVKDTRDYYTEILRNFYVMRRCNISGKDDIFIINSALMREIGLNGMPVGLRDEIFRMAKEQYSEKYADIDCKELQEKNPDMVKTYQNYISAVREILSATF